MNLNLEEGRGLRGGEETFINSALEGEGGMGIHCISYCRLILDRKIGCEEKINEPSLHCEVLHGDMSLTVHICRKIRGLGFVTFSLARAHDSRNLSHAFSAISVDFRSSRRLHSVCAFTLNYGMARGRGKVYRTLVSEECRVQIGRRTTDNILSSTVWIRHSDILAES